MRYRTRRLSRWLSAVPALISATITTVNGALALQLTFSGAVTGTSASGLTLTNQTQSTTPSLVYSSGSGTTTLTLLVYGGYAATGDTCVVSYSGAGGLAGVGVFSAAVTNNSPLPPAMVATALIQACQTLHAVGHTYLWQNTALTIPAVAAGDPVRVAVCPYTGVQFTAPSDAARPVLGTDGAGHWWLASNGSSSVLAFSLAQTLPGYVYASMSNLGGATTTRQLLARAANGWCPYPGLGGAGTTPEIYWEGGSAVWSGGVTGYHVVRYRAAVNATGIAVDGATEITGSGQTSTSDSWTGVWGGVTQPLQCNLCGLLLSQGSTLSSVQDAAAVTYLAALHP